MINFKKLALIILALNWLVSGLKANTEKEIFTQGKYTLTFINQDPDLNEKVKNGLIKTFFKVYPKMAKDFNPNATKSVTVTIDTAYNGVAYAHDGKITIASKWLKKKPNDLDVITHEGMHLVQAYPNGSGPGWLTEGIADYVRYAYGVDNKVAGWALPDWNPNHHYDNSYRITARFLLWLQINKNKKLVQKLDTHLRNKTYSEGLWEKFTGNSLEELWMEYAKSPGMPIIDAS